MLLLQLETLFKPAGAVEQNFTWELPLKIGIKDKKLRKVADWILANWPDAFSAFQTACPSKYTEEEVAIVLHYNQKRNMGFTLCVWRGELFTFGRLRRNGSISE